MLRSLLRASAAVAFALLLAPAVPAAAPPPGLAYDEIVRVVVSATPPPPGNFSADLAAVNAPPALASPTAAPRKRGLGGLANIAGAVLSGGGANAVAGAVAGEALGNAIDNAVQQSLGAQFAGLAGAMQSFLQPHLLRYAYWNGWERIDDVTLQTATIRKCDMGQVVELDLAHKTYTVATPGNEPTSAPVAQPQHRGRPAPAAPAQPGTTVATLSETTKVLGPMRIENQPTTGYDATTTFATTQSTGSCRDGSASIRTVQYISPLVRPAVNSCPIRRAPVPQTGTEVVTLPTGGCKPTLNVQRSGPTPPNRLALYSLVTITGSAGSAPQPSASPGIGGFGFLTERGNLKTLGAADAALFSVPADYTKAP